jgi:tRNA nucleotidyltransferase (CCA-adding enzyme)
MGLTLELPQDVLAAMAALEAAGHAAYLVGGGLRDKLRGAEPADYDIASSAKPDELPSVFAGRRLLDTGAAYGTMTLLTERRAIEITTFRADGAYSDGRRPDAVSYSQDVTDDLARRDFTVNAMAYSPQRGLLDLFGGQADLASGALRAVGDAASRLREDALRIMRALRFAATLGLSIDQALASALHAEKARLALISPERINAELMRLLAADGERLLPVLLQFGDVLAVPIPELGPTMGLDQKSPWHAYDVWEHTARALAASSPHDGVVRLALLLHDIGKPPTFTLDQNGRGHFYGHAPEGAEMARLRLQALRFDNRTVELACELISSHLATITPGSILRWLRRLGEAQLRRLIAVKMGDMSAHKDSAVEKGMADLTSSLAALDEAIAKDACFSLAQLAVGGDDLIAMGIHPGPGLGAMLDALLDAVVEGRLPNERQPLLAEARLQAEGGGSDGGSGGAANGDSAERG